jgi:ABC-type lipoprotein release transport system permease subunit
MAWRNLWRNKRRTIITIASVFFGVLLSTLMSSMQEGSYSSMIDNIVHIYSGYIQVHHEDYWENKTINNSFIPADSLLSGINRVDAITDMAPRLESFGLASSEEITKGSIVIGIDPEAEDAITGLKKWLKQGEYLRPGDPGVLLSSELARFLKLGVGDTLVIIGQGYHGISAAGKFPVRGILNLANPELNRQTIYMDLGVSQEFYTAPGLITALVLMVEDPYDIPKVMQQLRTVVSASYKAMTWDEMQPGILQMIEADRAGGIIMKLILYILIGFGIFGTVMMMIVERHREMGVMIAIGMRRFKLASVLLFETLYIGLIGVFAGFIGSIPVIAFFYNNPVRLTGKTGQAMLDMGFEPYLYFSWMPRVFGEQVFIVFILTMVVSLYPIYSAKRLEVHNALRG